MDAAASALAQPFRPPEAFQGSGQAGYSLLPLRFLPLDDNRYIASNIAGEHIVLPKETLRRLIRHELSRGVQSYDELKSRHLLLDRDSSVALDLLAAKYRTKQAVLSQFTSLFMFVVTLRCDQRCPYCQVSRQCEDKTAYDMTTEAADAAVEFMFKTPSPAIKVEFQGGEPLLNFELVKHITVAAKRRNEAAAGGRRDLAFVIATNLSPLTDEHLAFCREHDICLSTSLDGPPGLHNLNRPSPAHDSHQRTIDGIARARAVLGPDRVSALMTTTLASLSQPEAIVDEYIAQGFSSIFLRSINPYGLAIKSAGAQYSIRRWLQFYLEALDYIIRLNQQGTRFVEQYAALILRKILTPYGIGYVDLQSPAGMGTMGLVFNYDGDVYPSDEARMLAEMGDRTFRLGKLQKDSYETTMRSPALLQPLLTSMAEGVPMCSDCALLPYCGADPVRHYRLQGDVVGHKPTSEFCTKHMAIMKHLIRLLEDDPAAAKVLQSWVYGG